MSNVHNNKKTINKNLALLTNVNDIKVIKINSLYKIKNTNKLQAECILKQNNDDNNLYRARISAEQLLINNPRLLISYLEHNLLKV